MKPFFNNTLFFVIILTLLTTFSFAQGPPPPPGDDGTVDDVLPINIYLIVLLITGVYYGIRKSMKK